MMLLQQSKQASIVRPRASFNYTSSDYEIQPGPPPQPLPSGFFFLHQP